MSKAAVDIVYKLLREQKFLLGFCYFGDILGSQKSGEESPESSHIPPAGTGVHSRFIRRYRFSSRFLLLAAVNFCSLLSWQCLFFCY